MSYFSFPLFDQLSTFILWDVENTVANHMQKLVVLLPLYIPILTVIYKFWRSANYLFLASCSCSYYRNLKYHITLDVF